MILIYPPVAKISEPPAGVSILSGVLKSHNINCKVIDANIEGMLWLIKRSAKCKPEILKDRWSRRAAAHIDRNLSDLKDINVYKNISQYRQRVMELNRAISILIDSRFKISLADYADSTLIPLKSGDLLASARNYSENPFYPFFKTFLADEISSYYVDNDGILSSFNWQNNSSDYIGISLCYLSQALTAFALAGWIRAQFPEKKIVMGGGLVTSWMSMPAWNEPFKGLIDLMVKGRGEEAVVNLCTKNPLYTTNSETLKNININKHTVRYRPDFDVCTWDKYISPGRTLPFRTTTGCYWNRCRFCPEKAEGNSYKGEKTDILIDDLQYLVDKYHPEYIHFLDDAIPPRFLKSLALNNIVANNLNCCLNSKNAFKWYGFVRFTPELSDPDFCKALYRSGCRLLKLGLESGDQDVLDKMEKGTDLNLASKVLSCLKEAGIATYIYLLFGTHFEDEKAADRTFEYVVNHSDRISFLNTAIFNLPRFSEDADTLSTSLFSDADLSLYLNFKHPKGWDRKNVRLFLDKKFKKHPAIGNILQHDPPFFTSNHAIFLL